MEAMLQLLCPSSASRSWAQCWALGSAYYERDALRALKNALIGNPAGIAKVLELGLLNDVLNEVLSSLDNDSRKEDVDIQASDRIDDVTNSVLLQALGVVCVLGCHPSFTSRLSNTQAQAVLSHLKRSIEVGDHRVKCTALRTLTALCEGAFEWRTDGRALTSVWGDVELQVVTRRIFNHVINWRWAGELRLLGLATLASITREAGFAREVSFLAAASGTPLLQALLRTSRHGERETKAARNLQTERKDGGRGEVGSLLELLYNMSTQQPHIIGQWLADCGPAGEVFDSLKNTLHDPEEENQILAGLLLVQLFYRCGGMPPTAYSNTPPVCPATTTTRAATAAKNELSGPVHSLCPHLEHTIIHRVVPLFARVLSSWAKTHPFPAPRGASTGAGGNDNITSGCWGRGNRPGAPWTGGKHASAATALDSPPWTMTAPMQPGARVGWWPKEGSGRVFRYAEVVARAVAEATGQGTRSQREVIRSGAVDALVAWLLARDGAVAASPGSGCREDGGGSCEVEEAHGEEEGTGAGVGGGGGGGEGAMREALDQAALSTLASLCSSSEEARERVVNLGLHLRARSWISACFPCPPPSPSPGPGPAGSTNGCPLTPGGVPWGLASGGGGDQGLGLGL
ncbi:unnamed protein product, partial [Discosporangium mesarthrocarpum]